MKHKKGCSEKKYSAALFSKKKPQPRAAEPSSPHCPSPHCSQGTGKSPAHVLPANGPGLPTRTEQSSLPLTTCSQGTGKSPAHVLPANGPGLPTRTEQSSLPLTTCSQGTGKSPAHVLPTRRTESCRGDISSRTAVTVQSLPLFSSASSALAMYSRQHPFQFH